MDLVLVFTLTLCCWAAEATTSLPGKPELLASTDWFTEGGSVRMTCVLPFDYGGGECRLYRGNNNFPLKVTRESNWYCVFNLTSEEVSGEEPLDTKVLFTCDYHLAQYTSAKSNIKAVTVTGISPRPTLSVGKRVVLFTERVLVECTPPIKTVYSLEYFSNGVSVINGASSYLLLGKKLTTWENHTLLHPTNLTCRYFPYANPNMYSEYSEPQLLLVLDPAQASSSMDCSVQVENHQLEKFGNTSWTYVGENGQTIRVQVSNITQTSNKTVDCVKVLD